MSFKSTAIAIVSGLLVSVGVPLGVGLSTVGFGINTAKDINVENWKKLVQINAENAIPVGVGAGIVTTISGVVCATIAEKGNKTREERKILSVFYGSNKKLEDVKTLLESADTLESKKINPIELLKETAEGI